MPINLSNEKILFVIISAAILFGCKKDQNNAGNNTDYSKLIVGKWNFTQDTLRVYKNGVLQSVSTNPVVLAYEQYNADGTASQGFGGNVTTFSYTIAGNAITYNIPAQTLNGSPIPLSTKTATIKNLTANSLELLFDTDYNDNSGNVTKYSEVEYLSK
jgi:hypothetical protein